MAQVSTKLDIWNTLKQRSSSNTDDCREHPMSTVYARFDRPMIFCSLVNQADAISPRDPRQRIQIGSCPKHCTVDGVTPPLCFKGPNQLGANTKLPT